MPAASRSQKLRLYTNMATHFSVRGHEVMGELEGRCSVLRAPFKWTCTIRTGSEPQKKWSCRVFFQKQQYIPLTYGSKRGCCKIQASTWLSSVLIFVLRKIRLSESAFGNSNKRVNPFWRKKHNSLHHHCFIVAIPTAFLLENVHPWWNRIDWSSNSLNIIEFFSKSHPIFPIFHFQ